MKQEIIKEALKLLKLTEKRNPGLKGYEIDSFNVNDCEGFIAKKDNWLCVAFKATDSLKDAVHDLMAMKTFFHGLKVHRGFEHYYSKVEFLIGNQIGMDNTIENILICGHSMGAAIATLCAYDLMMCFENINIYCITTGSPRVGSWKFSKAFNKVFKDTSFRLKNGNDIVSQVPPWFFLYKHVGIKKQIGNWKWWRFWGSVKDHDLDEYIREYNKLNI